MKQGGRHTGINAAERMVLEGAGHVHMAGICGIGMAGVAVLLKARGFKVTGCDLVLSSTAEILSHHGIEVVEGHDPSHVAGDVAWVVRTSALPPDSGEIAAAERNGVGVVRRGEVLAAMLAGTRSVAVAGTHGKTTTSGFITQIMRECGRSPSFCIGGMVDALGGMAGKGDSDLLVVEADESDGTVAHYRPDIGVITGIEFDHVEKHGSIEEFESVFRDFISKVRDTIVYCADDAGASALCREAGTRALSYGFSDGASIRGAGLSVNAKGSTFRLLRGGKDLGEVSVALPGRHNALNALGATAAAIALDLPVEDVCAALPRLGLARRRFEKMVEGDITVINDYAHHPSEIRAFVSTADMLPHARTIAVFQPHRYSRTAALGADFPGSFDGVDLMLLLPVYAASEAMVEGGTVWDLYGCFRQCRVLSDVPVIVASSLEQAWAYLRKELRSGDLLLVVGAGDVEEIAETARREFAPGIPSQRSAAEELHDRLDTTEIRYDEPLSGKTTLRVGGEADVWLRIGSEKDLVEIIRWSFARGVPFRLIGGGSNLLVSDLGVRGAVGRLTGDEFRTIRLEGDRIVAGAGVTTGTLLNWMEERELGGLEFLDGVPGTLGGAVRMNAGTRDEAIGDRLLWVRYLDSRGDAGLVEEPQCGYRRGVSCGAVVEVGFRCGRDAADAIRARREQAAGKRAWMKGLRSAGSVFMNTDKHFAGRLIEEAGLKGLTVGGARISEQHANVIIAGDGARASDVQALMARAALAVKSRFGVDLTGEITMWV